MKKRYLGDGVYIAVEHGMFMLTTEDGIRVTNTIALEPEVYHALVKYAGEAFAFYAKKEEPRSLNENKEDVPPPVDGEFEFHCAEFDGCRENYCAYPGEEDCAMRSGSVNEDKEIPL